MGRLSSALAFVATALAACSAFGTDEASTTAAPRADAGVGTDPDAGPPTPPSDADGGPELSLCATAAPFVFCDDFESTSFSTPWSDEVDRPPTGNGMKPERLPAELGPGHAFHVAVTPSSGAAQETTLRYELGNPFVRGKSHIELRARVFVVSSTVDYARLASFTLISGGRYESTGLAMSNRETPQLDDSEDRQPAVDGVVVSAKTGTWRRLVATLDAQPVGNLYRREVRLDDILIAERPDLDFSGLVIVSALEVGVFSSVRTALADGGSGSVDVWIDDVVMTAY